MSVIGYSTCRIQFTPNDEKNPKRDYSDRSYVELRQYDDIADYSLRAVDVENNTTEIFNFRIKDLDDCRLGESDNEPDEINDSNGTYGICLNGDSRGSFHKTFSTILEMLFPDKLRNTRSESVKQSSINTDSNKTNKPNIPESRNCDVRDILINVHNLSRSIKQGNNDQAARLATQLTSQGVRIQAKSFQQLQNEEPFRILVQIDGNEYGIDQNGGAIPVEIFPSTTVRELRAAFELAFQYCSMNQYFFVNGHLIHDDSAMIDLKVGPNSLFVLFLLTYPKKFKNNAPWECPVCSTQNQENDLKCALCLASRIE